MRIAIHQNDDIFCHSTSWSYEWISYCKENDITYGVVNAFDNNIFEIMKEYDVLLWHFSHYSSQEMQFARSIMNVLKSTGVKVFPDYNSSWHFDDKISEMYLLKSINAPIPKSLVFYTEKSTLDFFASFEDYPVVAKLKAGSGSSNVKIINNYSEVKKYANQIFGKGFQSAPSVLFKSKSNLMSSKNINDIIKKAKRIPDFIQSLTKSKRLPRERDYFYFQEFIPNDGYDLKVVVVGNKLSFLNRDVRKGDFRASGGGSVKYDKELITSEIRKIAFNLSKKLGFLCMGYDFVIDKNTKKPHVVEISYGFSHTAQMG